MLRKENEKNDSRRKKRKLVKLFSKCAFRKIIYLYMYIDENNPKYIFDDIFALLLHFNEYTSLIIFIEENETTTTQDKGQRTHKRVKKNYKNAEKEKYLSILHTIIRRF